MVKWFAGCMLDKFGRRWNYDVGYMREMLAEGGLSSMFPLQALEKVSSYRRDVPLDAYHAAKIAATKSADCGSCLQLVVRMAEADGISPAIIRAVLEGNTATIPADALVGFNLARATVARDPEGREIGALILKQWGRRALITLGYAIVAASAFPMFKYAIGHGHACERVMVDGVNIQVAPLGVRT